MAGYDLHFAGPLVAIRYANDWKTRQKDFRLGTPPKLNIITYSYEHDQWSVKPIEWDAAQALAPDCMEKIGLSLKAARGREMDDFAKEAQA